MSLVRLRCPACSAVVKISEEMAQAHPVVRCAGCQGMVNVAASRLAEPESRIEETRPKKQSRPKSSRSAAPMGLIFGIIAGIVLLIGAGVGVYFLVDAFSVSGPEKYVKKALALLERAVIAMESVKTLEDIPAAKFDEIAKDGEKLNEESRSMDMNIDDATKQKIFQKYQAKSFDLISRLQAAAFRIGQNGALAHAMRQHWSMLGPNAASMFGGVGLSGINNMNLPSGNSEMANGLSERKPSGQTTDRANDRINTNEQMELENAVITKANMAAGVALTLSSVHDNASAEQALANLDGIMQILKEQDSKLTRLKDALQSKNIRPTGGRLAGASQDLMKAITDIHTHMERIAKMSDMASWHSRMTRRLNEAGLQEGSGSTITGETGAAESKPNETEESPFKPAGKESKSNESAKKEPGNPFEPATGGSKPSSGSNMNSMLDATLAKLASGEHFKKQEGIREAGVAKFEEGRKKEVLDALLPLFEDNDVHQKSDVLKAWKKWATTQEDKDRISAIAESLLKDHWAKKDALRYFSENKIISSGKDVARLLKDHFDRKDAAEVLIALGSEVEPVVMPYLNDLDSQVRHMTIEVLARIGTKACLPDLQRLLSDRSVGLAAKQAIQLIQARKK